MNVRASVPGHFAWLVERTSCAITPGFRAIEAVDDEGRILGMVGFDGWWGEPGQGGSVQMHVAIEKPIAVRRLAPAAFDYVFRQAGKDVAIGVVPAHNRRALEFDLHLGFREVHRVRDGWARGDDVVLLEMRRDDCRFLRGGR